ncbi:MAG: FecR domain-containing protein [Dehalococcoidia bacterium]|nr:FecR domain-containing protein [Dehalococcoidia bacterium]
MTRKQIILSVLAVSLAVILLLGGLILVPSVFSSQTSYSDSTTLSILSGDVFVMKGSTGQWKEAHNGMKLSAADSVKTSVDSYAAITFFEGSTITLDPDTEVSIGQIERLPQTGSTVVRLKQKAGQTWNRVQKLTDTASKYEVETTAAVAAVRGTTIRLAVGTDGQTTMSVFQGEGSLLAQGVSVTVTAGTQSTARPGGQPSAVSPIPISESMLRLSVNSESAWMKAVDPAARSAGTVRPGITVNQIPGAITSSYGDETRFIEIPNPSEGTFSLVLVGQDDAQINLVVEGFVRNGTALTRIFRQERQCQTGKNDRWRIDLQTATQDGILDQITLPAKIERLKGDEPGRTSVTQGAVDGRIAELASRFDQKYAAFKYDVYRAVSGEKVTLTFSEEEIAGKLMKWVTGPDNPAEMYNMEAGLNSDGTVEASARFKYAIFRGKLNVKARVIIEAAKPRIDIIGIDFDLGKLPLPIGPFKGRINEEAKKITWDLNADLIGAETTGEHIVLTVIKR